MLGNSIFSRFYPSTADDSSTTTTTEHHSLDGEIFDKFKNLSDSIHGNTEGREAAEDPVWDQHDVDVRTLGKTKVFFVVSAASAPVVVVVVVVATADADANAVFCLTFRTKCGGSSLF